MCLLTHFSKCPRVKLGEKGGEGLRAFLERQPQWEQVKRLQTRDRVAERGDSPSLSHQLTKMHNFLSGVQCLLVS